MAQAKESSLRLKIITDRAAGTSYAELTRRYGIHYHTVRNLCLRFEAEGDAALRPRYARCGRRPIPSLYKSFRFIRLLKHLHPDWGIAYILAKVKERYPDLPLQSVRHYQRKICSMKQQIPKSTLPKKPNTDRPRLPHDEWEIDAKERIKLEDGSEVCFLNITDAKTHALLKAKVFPPTPDQSGAH